MTAIRLALRNVVSALLIRFDTRSAEVCLGLTESLYGFGGLIGRGDSPFLSAAAFVFGLVTQVLSYRGSTRPRRLVNAVNSGLWLFVSLHWLNQGHVSMFCGCVGLAITAGLVSVRATSIELNLRLPRGLP